MEQAGWQKNMAALKGIESTFVVEGNVNDYYLSKCEDGATEFLPLHETLEKIFNEGRTGNLEDGYCFLAADPINGFSNPLGHEGVGALITCSEAQITANEREKELLNKQKKAPTYSDNRMVHVSQVVRAMMTQADDSKPQEQAVVLVIDCAARYLSSPEGLSIDETTFFLNLLYASQHAIRVKNNSNTLVLVVEKQSDLPAWFYSGNSDLHLFTLEKPNRATREQYITNNFPVFAQAEEKSQDLKQKFVDVTSEFSIKQLDHLRRIIKRDNTPVEATTNTVDFYKYGYRENPWESMRPRLQNVDLAARLTQRVKGQDVAVEQVVTTVKRAVMGVSGLQHSSANKPRGVLFLADPTGTGKTEIVKAMTELLFGEEDAMIRFDMSEYAHEAADQKLFGSPPGYVGHSEGGQLTNAVKRQPCCVLLFDEIEKAHPKLLEKFLQILEDARMTDGRGETISFAQTFILFTSNVGISQERFEQGRVVERVNIVQPGVPYPELCQKIKDAMKTQFKPEVLNRIGNDNVVVFDFIGEEAVKLILQSKLKNINEYLLKEKSVEIHLSSGVVDALFAVCMQPDCREHGGRGVVNVIESNYLNALAETIYVQNTQSGDVLAAKAVDGKIVFCNMVKGEDVCLK